MYVTLNKKTKTLLYNNSNFELSHVYGNLVPILLLFFTR